LIKRSSIDYINTLLSKKSDWKILDIGCGLNPNRYANVICDIQDLSKFYKGKKFVKIIEKKLPFKDKEFDFVIASHVMEHVEHVEFFIKELERISSKGYIELPTKLEDNLVFENKKEHLWHMDFEDVDCKLLISKKIQFFEPILTVGTIKKFNKIFRKSLILELYWEDKIEYSLDEIDKKQIIKFSITNLLKKFFSKKIRMLLR